MTCSWRKQTDRRGGIDRFFPVLRGAALLILTVSTFTPLPADSDLALVRGLADRGMFESVEYLIGKRLRQPNLPEPEKYALAAELVRARTSRILLEEPSRRPLLLERLDHFEREILARPDDNGKTDESFARISFQFQRGIAERTLGDWERIETDLVDFSERELSLKRSRETLLNAIERFQACARSLDALRRTTGSNADLFFERRLLALERSVRFQWGLAQMSLALTFPDGDDRTFGLNKAVDILNEIALLRIDDPTVFHARIELATASRLLGDTEKCRALLFQLRESPLSPELRFSAESERIRYLIAVDRPDEAFRLFKQEDPDATEYPDFELARLELFLALSRRTESNESLFDTILDSVRKIERQSGSYWGRRARILLGASTFAEHDKTDPTLLTLLAEEQYQSGRYSEAVALFDRAGRIAETAGDAETAFSNAKASVAVLGVVLDRLESSGEISNEEKEKYRRQLIESLRDLSKRFSKRDEAAELHLKGIDLAAESVLQTLLPLDDYLSLLKEHAELWPRSVKVPPLLLRASLLLEQQGSFDDALSLLEKIPNHSPVGLEAVLAASRCFDAGETENDMEAATWFRKRLSEDRPDWNEADAISALQAAEHLIKAFAKKQEDKDSLRLAERLLRAALKHSPNSEPATRARLRALLVSALVEQGRKEEGAEILKSFHEDQLGKLAPEEQRTFQRVQAKLLADTGNPQDAVDLLTELLKQSPNDLSLWEILADLLGRRNDAETLGKALKIWTKIEKESRKDTEIWWNARERIIDILLKQGKTGEAQRSFELLRLLYPELGGGARKIRLEKRFSSR